MDALIHRLNAVIEEVLIARNMHLSARDFEQFYASYLANKEEAKGVEIADDVRLGLYLACRMPATTAALLRIFLDLPSEFKPRTISDLGSGSGSAIVAATEVFQSIERVTAVDANEELMGLASVILGKLGSSFAYKVETGSYLSMDSFANADLVTLSYTLNEIPTAERLHVVARAWAATTGMLVVVEPGSNPGFTTIMDIRDWAIEEGIHVLAPCSHHGVCPLRAIDWCHFHARFPRSKRLLQVKRGTLGYEDEPYTYIVLSRKVYDRGGNRILRAPTKVAHGLKVGVCTPSVVTEKIVPKSDSGYKQLKRLRAGDRLC